MTITRSGNVALFVAWVVIFCLPGCSKNESAEDSSHSGSEHSTTLKKPSFEEGSRPNILLITIDTLRADYLGCYGRQDVDTKSLDRISREGTVFLKCFAHTPSTLPSHVTIMTGTLPTVHGVHSNLGFKVQAESNTLAETLSSNGYETGAFIGAFPLDSRFGLDQGFDTYDDQYGMRTVGKRKIPERTADEVVSSALSWMIKKREEKWFAWVHVFDPHLPYAPPDDYAEKYKNNLYAGEVSYTDHALNRLFEYLRSSEIIDDTLIVITADHGEALGDHGERSHELFAYNSTIWVPLIMRFPPAIPAGSEIERRVRHIDLMPSILEFAGISIPAEVQGQSLIALIRGNSNYNDPDSYFEALGVPLTRGWAPLHGLIHGQWKYIDLPIPELYDLESDFRETNNRIDTLAGSAKRIKEILNEKYLEGKNAKPGEINRDEETLRKLASLGYLSTSSPVEPAAHGPQNDPKRLVGIHNKLEIASELSESGDFSRAKKMLNEIIEERSDFVFVYLLLSSILRQEGDIEGAIAVLQGALAATKSDDRISFQLARELVESGDLFGAHRIAQDLHERNPGDPHSARLLAKCESLMGNRQKAAEILLKCIRDYPDFVDVRVDLGRIYLEVKKYQVALNQFESALSFNPESADAHYGRGLALEALRQPEQALRAHTEALKFRPEFIDAHFRLGLIHEYLGHYSEALKHFNEVINLGPPLKRSQAEKLKARVRTKMKS